MRPDQLERRLRERLDALGPAPRAELLHVPDAPRLRARRPDRRVLELPGEPHLRRTSHRLRGGPDAPGGAPGDAARVGTPMDRRHKVWVAGVPPVSGGMGHTAERHQAVAAAMGQISNHAIGRIVALTAIARSGACTGGGGGEASDASEGPTHQPSASSAPSAGGSVDELVQVNGRGLYLACTPGEGPTVVFSHGVGGQSVDWDATLSNLADIPTCVYDRVNVGLSDREAGRHSATDDVEDLHAPLEVAGIEPPYVLVGHSFGGMEMLMYAGTYPEDVEGIVLADAPLPFESLLDPPDRRAEIRAELNANPKGWTSTVRPPRHGPWSHRSLASRSPICSGLSRCFLRNGRTVPMRRRCIASSRTYPTAAWSNWLRIMTSRWTSPKPSLMLLAKPCRRAASQVGGHLMSRSRGPCGPRLRT
jgi:pimeloyl-ACP methyl ester carboxylesterase